MASKSSPGAKRRPAAQAENDPGAAAAATAASLSYREAHTALELILAELQSPDLDVEQMAAHYRRAQAYAQRCEEILGQVEQEVLLWDPSGEPSTPPSAYTP